MKALKLLFSMLFFGAVIYSQNNDFIAIKNDTLNAKAFNIIVRHGVVEYPKIFDKKYENILTTIIDSISYFYEQRKDWVNLAGVNYLIVNNNEKYFTVLINPVNCGNRCHSNPIIINYSHEKNDFINIDYALDKFNISRNKIDNEVIKALRLWWAKKPMETNVDKFLNLSGYEIETTNFRVFIGNTDKHFDERLFYIYEDKLTIIKGIPGWNMINFKTVELSE